MRRFRRYLTATGAALGLACLLTVNAEAQGPFSAQIQMALRAFLGQAHTWTATQTFSGGIDPSITGLTTGDLITAASATSFGRLADVTTGQVLVSGGVGVAPAYSANPAVTTLTTNTTLTGIVSTPGVQVNQTWNNAAGIFNGIVLSVTDTASAAASQFITLGSTAGINWGVRRDGSMSSTNTFTYPGGITIPNGSAIGVTSGGALFFRSDATAAGWIQLGGNANQTHTTGFSPHISTADMFTPGSGSGSWAALEVNPIINGTSSGTAYGLVVASKTNTLTGGAIKLFSVGTTTNNAITGYNELLYIATTGAVVAAGVPGITKGPCLPANITTVNGIVTAMTGGTC